MGVGWIFLDDGENFFFSKVSGIFGRVVGFKNLFFFVFVLRFFVCLFVCLFVCMGFSRELTFIS